MFWKYFAVALVVTQVAISQEPIEKPLSEFFSDYKVPTELSAELTLLNNSDFENGVAGGQVVAALIKIQEYKGAPEDLYKFAPSLLRIIGKASDRSLQVSTLNVLTLSLLKDKMIDREHTRIAKELVKLLRQEKDPEVAAKIRTAIAWTGDPMSVAVFTDAVKEFRNNKKQKPWDDLSEYFSRIGVNPRVSVPIPGFQRLEEELKLTFDAERYAENAQSLWLREVAMSKLRAGDSSFLNRASPAGKKSAPTHSATPAPKK